MRVMIRIDTGTYAESVSCTPMQELSDRAEPKGPWIAVRAHVHITNRNRRRGAGHGWERPERGSQPFGPACPDAAYAAA